MTSSPQKQTGVQLAHNSCLRRTPYLLILSLSSCKDGQSFLTSSHTSASNCNKNYGNLWLTHWSLKCILPREKVRLRSLYLEMNMTDSLKSKNVLLEVWYYFTINIVRIFCHFWNCEENMWIIQPLLPTVVCLPTYNAERLNCWFARLRIYCNKNNNFCLIFLPFPKQCSFVINIVCRCIQLVWDILTL